MKSGNNTRQYRHELLSILIIQEDVLLRIPLGRDVIERPRKFDAKWTSHMWSLAGQSYNKQDLTPPS